MDLYAQLSVVADGKPFGSPAAFKAEYGDPTVPADKRQVLAGKIAPFLLRRTKEECLDLPEKTFVDVIVELPAWQRKMYDAMRDDLAHEVEGMSEEQFRSFLPTAMTRLLRLSQVASNPALILPNEHRIPGKLAELDGLVSELVDANGRKVIIWSYYVATIEMIAARYADRGVIAIYGATPAEERQPLATQFQDDPSVHVMVANPSAAGTGLTLTAATYSIYETLTWRYDLYAQSQDRNHRIGQRNPVTYIRLLAADTIERAIVAALEGKALMAADLLGDEGRPAASPTMTPELFLRLLRSGDLPPRDN